MGVLETKLTNENSRAYNVKAIDDIYNMFQESNSVLLGASKQLQSFKQLKLKIVEETIDQLLEPFQQHNKYAWAEQICSKFKKHFSNRFQDIWTVNREQFYGLLLKNCNVDIGSTFKNKNTTIQNYFYEIAIHEIETNIDDSFVGQIFYENNLDRLNVSILKKQQQSTLSNKDSDDLDILPLALSINETKIETQLLKQMTSGDKQQSKCKEMGRLRIQNSSILLPETIFVERVNLNLRQEITDLLKYYKQFTNTIQQIICSNNLVSCPLKNFIFCLEEKLSRKKIKLRGELQKQQFLSMQTRKLRKTREINNNLLLHQIKYFLQAYTSFVMMYLQLHLMAQTRLGKIINYDIVYGIIFKHLWGFVEWIGDRGFEYEQFKLEELCQSNDIKHQNQISETNKKFYFSLLQNLRGEKHPQQYVKKVVIFYRQVSKKCQNADELLTTYEEIVSQLIKEKGGKGLRIFKMPNIIQKLLRVDQNSTSGGEIRYAWATWSILIQLLKQKIKTRGQSVVISQKRSEHQTKDEALSSEIGQNVIIDHQ